MGRKTGKGKGAKLALKEQRFIDNYLGQFNGNATKAAFDAGYGSTLKSASVLAVRLLGKVKIQQAIAARTSAEQRRSIADADERDTVLTDILRDTRKNALSRISAVKELNKCTGRHSMTHLHKGKVTLGHALALSRKPEAKSATV